MLNSPDFVKAEHQTRTDELRRFWRPLTSIRLRISAPTPAREQASATAPDMIRRLDQMERQLEEVRITNAAMLEQLKLRHQSQEASDPEPVAAQKT